MANLCNINIGFFFGIYNANIEYYAKQINLIIIYNKCKFKNQ